MNNPATTIAQLDHWIATYAAPEAYQWFAAQRQQIAQEPAAPLQERHLVKAMGLAARKLGKADMPLSPDDLAQAHALRPGFDPSGWSLDQAARVAFILASFNGDEAQFAARLDRLADSAEINELIALYCGFALYPGAHAIEPRAREAIRSSMRPVFEAMAQRNPYPMEQFDDAAWNQMIVKSFFLDSPLWPIQGVDARTNPDLAHVLVDLAHERWAAGRPISPELWRCVAPHADEKGFAALQRVLDTGSETEKIAVALALQPCADSPVRLRCTQEGLSARAASVTWPRLMQDWAGWAD